MVPQAKPSLPFINRSELSCRSLLLLPKLLEGLGLKGPKNVCLQFWASFFWKLHFWNHQCTDSSTPFWVCFCLRFRFHNVAISSVTFWNEKFLQRFCNHLRFSLLWLLHWKKNGFFIQSLFRYWDGSWNDWFHQPAQVPVRFHSQLVTELAILKWLLKCYMKLKRYR